MISIYLIAFLYRLTYVLIYVFVENIDLYIVGFLEKKTKQNKTKKWTFIYFTALCLKCRYIDEFPFLCVCMLDGTLAHVLIHCQRSGRSDRDLGRKAVHDVFYLIFFMLFKCPEWFCSLYFKSLFYGYCCTSKDFLTKPKSGKGGGGTKESSVIFA